MDSVDKLFTNRKDLPQLSFVVEEGHLPGFFTLFQAGVGIWVHVGCSLKSFLDEEMGVGPETLEKIQSIFLDGSAVDDLESAFVKNGSVLALSAAMPGLVGATMRRGGRYSSFRSSVTYHETESRCVPGEGLVQVKLFNLLMAELGPELLKRGVIVRSPDMIEFLSGRSGDFWQGCVQILLNGRTIGNGMTEVSASISHAGEIFLSVEPIRDRF